MIASDTHISKFIESLDTIRFYSGAQPKSVFDIPDGDMLLEMRDCKIRMADFSFALEKIGNWSGCPVMSGTSSYFRYTSSTDPTVVIQGSAGLVGTELLFSSPFVAGKEVVVDVFMIRPYCPQVFA